MRMMNCSRDFILPVAAGDGEGDRSKSGGGASGALRPTTMLRMVPLPMGFAHREDEQ